MKNLAVSRRAVTRAFATLAHGDAAIIAAHERRMVARAAYDAIPQSPDEPFNEHGLTRADVEKWAINAMEV